MTIKEIDQKYEWSKWKPFPDPRKGDYIHAPLGFGVYQLRNNKTKEYVLFGRSKTVAYRMSSLLPYPYRQGNRTSTKKQNYVFKNLADFIYRTVICSDEKSTKLIEKEIKTLKIHEFND